MNSKSIRFAVIGCGYFGLKRIETLASLGNLAGVVDSDEKRLKTIASRYNTPHATSIEQLTKSCDIDAAIVAVPNFLHASITEKALSCGLHVICEKPLAINAFEAERIVQAAKKYHRFVKTGSNHRFFPTVQKAYKLYTKGTIGDILHFNGSIGTNGAHTQESWFWEKHKSGGGTFIDNGCHLLDIARMFMGDFTSCIGYTSNVYWKKTRVEDLGTGIFMTKNGRQATISSSWIQWRGYMYFELWGTKGYIIVDSREGDRVIWGKRDGSKPNTIDFTKLPKASYRDEILYFSHCIRTNQKPVPSVRDGYRVIQMIEGVYESVNKNKLITLPS